MNSALRISLIRASAGAGLLLLGIAVALFVLPSASDARDQRIKAKDKAQNNLVEQQKDFNRYQADWHRYKESLAVVESLERQLAGDFTPDSETQDAESEANEMGKPETKDTGTDKSNPKPGSKDPKSETKSNAKSDAKDPKSEAKGNAKSDTKDAKSEAKGNAKSDSKDAKSETAVSKPPKPPKGVGELQWMLSKKLYELAQKHGVRIVSVKYGLPSREGTKGTDLEALDVEFAALGVYSSLKPFMLALEGSHLPFAVVTARLEESPEGARMSAVLRAFRKSATPVNASRSGEES